MVKENLIYIWELYLVSFSAENLIWLILCTKKLNLHVSLHTAHRLENMILLVSLCRFGHVFTWDSGNSVGEIMGQSGSINSCDLRKDRPMRCVTASEDNSVAFFEGPPFKFKSTLNEHKVRIEQE